MKKCFAGLAVGVMMFGMFEVANAATVVDFYGDQDGFGIGLTNGAHIDWLEILQETDDEGFTDKWVYGGQSWTHSYDISTLGTLTEATLEIFTGGQGWYGLTEIYIDDKLIGTLTDGDDVGPEYDYAFIDTFDLMPFLSYFDGANTLKTVHVRSGDGWALDYSKLTFSDNAAPVPEPATMILFGTGLAGLAASRRRKKVA